VAVYSVPVALNSQVTNRWLTIGVFLFVAALLFVKGTQLTLAAGYFSKIVETKGNDIKNLLGAIGDLSDVYDAHWWFGTLVAVVILAATINFLR
jgi:hypothetical protein